MNLLEFIRKRILSNKAKHFDQNAKSLTTHLTSTTNMPSTVENYMPWDDCKKHDKALLKAFSDHGSKDFVTNFNKAFKGDKDATDIEITREWA